MMGLKGYTPPVVDVAPATARHRQCGTKIRWPSRWVADNAALLTTWKHPDDEAPLVAYACPWCSIPGDPGFHIGHIYRGARMQVTVPPEREQVAMEWLATVAPELNPRLVSTNVEIDTDGVVHLQVYRLDTDGNRIVFNGMPQLFPVTIVLGPDQPRFPPMPERAGREGDSQPMPTPSDAPDIQSLVIADIVARREVGIKRYGTALQPNNGRNALQDAYEEAIDLAMYLKQRLVEDGAA